MLFKDDAICWRFRVASRNATASLVFSSGLIITKLGEVELINVSTYARPTRLLRMTNMRPYTRHRREHHRGRNFPSSSLVMFFRLTVILKMTFCCSFGDPLPWVTAPRPAPLDPVSAIGDMSDQDTPFPAPQDEEFSSSSTNQKPMATIPAGRRGYA